MDQFFGFLLSGLVLGSQYGLFAVGLALIFGVVRVFNFGHGVLFVAGGYAMYALTLMGFRNVYIGILVAGLAGGLVSGLLLEFGVLTPTRNRGAHHFIEALATVGFTFFGIGILETFVGGEPRLVQVNRTVYGRIAGTAVTNTGITTLVAALVIMVALGLALRYTQFGLAMRAVADSPQDIELMGYSSKTVIRSAVLLSAVLAAVAGALLASHLTNIVPGLGNILMVKGVALVVVGGLGSIWGAVIVAFIVGVGESMTVGFIGSGWGESVALILLLVILLWRPTGLFGRTELERL